MPSKHRITLTVGGDVQMLLRTVRERDGTSEAEQIRRGLRLWFQSKGFGIDVQIAKRKAARLGARAERLGPVELVGRRKG